MIFGCAAVVNVPDIRLAPTVPLFAYTLPAITFAVTVNTLLDLLNVNPEVALMLLLSLKSICELAPGATVTLLGVTHCTPPAPFESKN